MALPGSDIYSPDGAGVTRDGAGKAQSDDLTDSDEKKAAKAAYAIWLSKDEIQSRREAQWRVNEWRRAGVKNVALRKKSEHDWYAWIPPHIEQNPDQLQTMNAGANQCRKFTSLIFADPPAPEAMPATGEEEDRDAAEFATRALIDVQGEGHLNDARLHRRAFDKANTYGSGFIWYYIDEHAGGRIPVEVSAGFDPATGRGATGEDDLLDDPESGLPWPEYREMFLTESGELTLDRDEAKMAWLPELRGRVLTGRNVRMIPHTAQGIDEAEGVQIAYFTTLSEIKRLYPRATENMSEEEEDDLLDFRPNRYEWLASSDELLAINQPPDERGERTVFCIVTIYRQGPRFEKGLYMATAGNGVVLERGPWVAEVDGAEMPLPLPLTQHRQFQEGDDDPYAHGLMELLGPGNEVRAKVISDWMDHLSWQLNRKMFLPMHSNLRNEDFRLPAKTPIRILPGGEPKYEDVPTFPADAFRLVDFVTGEMQTASGLTDIAQGLESPQVQSGRHAQAIVSQVHAGLSDVRQNVIDAYLRACRIQLALIKGFFKRERRVSWVGEDGAYKERRWTGADLRGTSDVKLKHGTMTMLSPVAKAQLAEHFFTLGVIDRVELREMTSGNMGPLVGMQDDPHLTRIRRQIARWEEGPPEGWFPQYAQQPAVGPNGEPQIDPQTGLPAMQQVQIPDPVLAGLFRGYPQDDLPYVAMIRLREISKAMSRSSFAVQPQEWQFGLVQEFFRAMSASQGAQGAPQPGQPPASQRSPAQNEERQGPLAPPETPLPTEAPGPPGQAGLR